MTERELKIGGRHDPCIAPRAVPVVEAAAAIALLDALRWRMNMNDELNALRREIDGIDAELVTLLKRRNGGGGDSRAERRKRASCSRLREGAHCCKNKKNWPVRSSPDGFGSIYSAILAASRSYQNALLGRENHEHDITVEVKAMICGLLGGKLGHSYSPQIHAELGDYKYRLFERAPEELDAFFADRSWTGVNVTIPYKRAAMKYCDVISERAARIGA